MTTREVPIVIITGYLGSGKTTLMQNILKQEKRKIALIVNDMGSINIDASILNKTDLLSVEQLGEVKDGLRGLQQEAEMIECVNGEVDLDVILDREDFDFEEVEAYSAVQRALNNCEHDDEKACVDEYGISSFVFEERKPFNRESFNKLVEDYPEVLIRSKGYIWFSDDWKHIQLFEQAGRNASITELSEWVSAWPKEELDKVVLDFPDIKDDWDDHYGDRCNQVVFIGKGYEKADIVKRLYECIDEAC